MGLDPAEAVVRQRIEFRAGLAIAAATAFLLLVPANTASTGGDDVDGLWRPAIAIPFLVAAVATFGATGWWIDAIRQWWGPHEWVHPRSSLKGWLIPFVNMFTPPHEMRSLFTSAARPAWWANVWTVGWLLVILLNVFHLDGPASWVTPLLSCTLLGALVLWLGVSSMRSLRRAWQRQDDLAEATGNPSVG